MVQNPSTTHKPITVAQLKSRFDKRGFEFHKLDDGTEVMIVEWTAFEGEVFDDYLAATEGHRNVARTCALAAVLSLVNPDSTPMFYKFDEVPLDPDECFDYFMKKSREAVRALGRIEARAVFNATSKLNNLGAQLSLQPTLIEDGAEDPQPKKQDSAIETSSGSESQQSSMNESVT